MAKQIINVATPNSTTGDPLRNAFIKTNDNFTELYDKDVAIDAAVALNTAKVTNATHTGEVTGATALTITNNAVTNAKLAQVPTKTFKGRTSASTGSVEDLTVAQVRTDLSINNVNNTSDENKPAVSDSVVGIVNNVSLQELGGADKLINGVRVGRGGGNLIGNTASGGDALKSNTTGGSNTASGFFALFSNTTGSGNTALGNLSGVGITTGNGNTILGANITELAPDLTNNIILSSGDGVIKAQHDGANWALTGNVTAPKFIGALTGVASGNVTGTGTTNQLAKFTASGAVGNSSIFDNGNVGINTTIPNLTSANRTTVDINGVSQSLLALSVGGTARGFLFHTGTNLLLSNEILGALKFNVNGAERAGILSNGNFGINQPNPTERLDVIGNGKFSGTVTANGLATTGSSSFTDNGNSFSAHFSANNQTNGIAFGTNISNKTLIQGYTKTFLAVADIHLQTVGGNVGVNQLTPTERLDVVGNGKFSGTVSCGQFTTATEPAYVKGAQFFNTTLNKIRIGGATAYETVTST